MSQYVDHGQEQAQEQEQEQKKRASPAIIHKYKDLTVFSLADPKQSRIDGAQTDKIAVLFAPSAYGNRKQQIKFHVNAQNAAILQKFKENKMHFNMLAAGFFDKYQEVQNGDGSYSKRPGLGSKIMSLNQEAIEKFDFLNDNTKQQMTQIRVSINAPDGVLDEKTGKVKNVAIRELPPKTETKQAKKNEPRVLIRGYVSLAKPDYEIAKLPKNIQDDPRAREKFDRISISMFMDKSEFDQIPFGFGKESSSFAIQVPSGALQVSVNEYGPQITTNVTHESFRKLYYRDGQKIEMENDSQEKIAEDFEQSSVVSNKEDYEAVTYANDIDDDNMLPPDPRPMSMPYDQMSPGMRS